MRHRAAILDDYQNIAMQMADWSPLAKEVDIQVFNAPLGDEGQVIAALKGFSIICPMRERTSLSRRVIESLPDLRLIATTGMRNAAIDVAAARERHVTVTGTEGSGHATAELTIGLMLELARKIGFESARMKSGTPWQTTVGIELAGRTLGIIGLGKLGSRVAAVGKALGMRVLAWSQNLTAEKCHAAGAEYADKDDLLRQSDFVTVHLVLSERSRGLIGARELSLMKPTAYLINTARAPIVEESALLEALRASLIAGAGLDVFSVEPLPLDHPFRKLDNIVLTPHLGYATAETYRVFYTQTVEAIRAWLDGKPVRVIR